MTSIFQRLDTDNKEKAIPIYVCRPDDWSQVGRQLTPAQRKFAQARSFSGEAGQRVSLPDAEGNIDCVLYGVGAIAKDDIGPIRAGQIPGFLSKGLYYFNHLPSDWSPRLAATGWGMGAYKFDRYLQDPAEFPILSLIHI